MGIDSSEIDEVPTSSARLTGMLKQRAAGSTSAGLSGGAIPGVSSIAACGGGGASGGVAGAASTSCLGLSPLGASGDHHRVTASSGGVGVAPGCAGVSLPTPGPSGSSAKKEEKKGWFRTLFYSPFDAL